MQCYGLRCVEKDYCIIQTVWIAGLALQKTLIGCEHYTNYKILNYAGLVYIERYSPGKIVGNSVIAIDIFRAGVLS